MRAFYSKEYAWVDLSVVLLGRPVGGIRGIEYKIKHQKEVLFGAGNKGRSVQRGKKEFEGTITLLQSELIALNRAAQEKGYEDITDVDFDLIVSYAPKGGLITTDKVINVSITELPYGLKEGDLQQEHALPFIALDVETNVL